MYGAINQWSSASRLSRSDSNTATRISLWVDPALLSMRQRRVDRADGATLADRLQLSVSNLGEVPREV